MPHRDFTIVQYENPDPPSFSLSPEPTDDKQPESHHFDCLPIPPGGAIADLFLAFQGSITVKTAGCVQFIMGCLTDEDAERFNEVIHDKKSVVRTDKLSEIAMWLVETYTLRPSMPSSGSANGSQQTRATSEDGADSPGSTSEALASQS